MGFQQGAPTIHNEARPGDIAKTVLMPGDPMRAKHIAENYLQDVFCFNKVRGMLGFTGNYKGKRVSVMGSGMGAPSMGIYSFELFKFYDVDNIIRIGTCGSSDINVDIMDIILATKSYSQSTFALMQAGFTENNMPASEFLNKKIIEASRNLNIELVVGPVTSGDTFYTLCRDELENFDTKGGEMEAFALFCNAKSLEKNASCLLTVTDNRMKSTSISSSDREKCLDDMVTLALESAIALD